MHILILAGGEGTRLWPLSKKDFPKQFLCFGEENSLLQKTILRFSSLSFVQSISIATTKSYAFLVMKEIEKIGLQEKINIIVEPGKKNTAPAIAYSLKWLQEKLKLEEKDHLLILPSDHLIEPKSLFASYLEEIDPLLAQDNLLLFGIYPTRVETGYGYIQIGERNTALTYEVKAFVEKPHFDLAYSYLQSKDFYWNSGIFAANLNWFLVHFEKHTPEIFNLLQGSLKEAEENFHKMPEISFDYAILEKSKKVSVCPLPISWSDIGSWDSLYETMHKDANQNVFLGKVRALNTKGSLILGNKKTISTIGIEDLLIVDTEEAIFISKRGESQKVKELLEICETKTK